DGYLRRLARQEACGRRVLGTLARAFLAQKGQHALGFARLGDFARERLGLSARELQSLAHVSARLAQLPAVAAAFAAGALSWTQVRLLVGVATAETAAAWVETARSRTVRALEATIAQETGRPVQRDDTLDEEPRVQIRLACPRRVRERSHARSWARRSRRGRSPRPRRPRGSRRAAASSRTRWRGHPARRRLRRPSRSICTRRPPTSTGPR